VSIAEEEEEEEEEEVEEIRSEVDLATPLSPDPFTVVIVAPPPPSPPPYPSGQLFHTARKRAIYFSVGAQVHLCRYTTRCYLRCPVQSWRPGYPR
jgi:hypothetical protein